MINQAYVLPDDLSNTPLWVLNRPVDIELDITDPEVISFLKEQSKNMVHDAVLSKHTGYKIFYTETKNLKPFLKLLNRVHETNINIDEIMASYYKDVDGELCPVVQHYLDYNDYILKFNLKVKDADKTCIIVNRECVHTDDEVYQNCGDLQWFYYHENKNDITKDDMDKLIFMLSQLYEVSFEDMCS